MNEETLLILNALRELLIDPDGKNMPMRKLIAKLIDEQLHPIKEKTITEKTKDALSGLNEVEE